MAESYYCGNSYSYNNSGEYDYDYDRSESTYQYSFFAQPDSYSYASFSNNSSQVAYSQPKHVEYDPNLYYVPAQTQFLISYSVSPEFSVPEFEEYDPTPYVGGYDPTETYGKPLPPSDEICYPKSLSGPDSAHLNDSTSGSLKPPYDQLEPQGANVGSNNTSDPADNKVVESSAEPQAEDSKEVGVPEVDKGDSCEGGVEFERRVNQVPSGYGLETLDICESLFGYWPCLDRMKRADKCRSQGVYDEWGSDGQWNGTADYLFGTSNPYGEEWDREGR